jgi:hypothetical protein
VNTTYLTGALCRVGDLCFADAGETEVNPGAFVSIARADIAAVKTLPLYQRVVVIPADELARLQAERDAAVKDVVAQMNYDAAKIDAAQARVLELENEVAKLKAAIELGQENCDAEYDALRKERDEARATCAELVTDGNAITLAAKLARVTAERDAEFARSDTELAAAAEKESALRADLARVTAELAEQKNFYGDHSALRARVAELEAWKESAAGVMNRIDLQAVGAALGVPLGCEIGPEILPGIQSLKVRADKAEQHNAELAAWNEHLKAIIDRAAELDAARKEVPNG